MKIPSTNLERVARRIADIEAVIDEVGAGHQMVGSPPTAPTRFRDLLAEYGVENPRCSTRSGYPQSSGSMATTDELDAHIAQAAAKYGIRPSLLRAVMQVESGGNPHAVSPKGAQGLMQLMPGTAAGLGVTDPFDPAQNIMGGAQYLRQQLDRFEGDESLALAAYNAGPGAVLRHHGIPPYAETRRYVDHVLSLAGEGE